MRVVVVMPARNEEALISESIASIPEIVDWIGGIDEGSTDKTCRLSQSALGARGEVGSTQGLGVGGAIEIGCKKALTRFGQNCVIVVMAGDGQMDPRDLEAVIQPVLDGRADHVKGNRWLHPDGPKGMPFIRRMGTWWLSRLTSLASGVRIRDSQCGYTATSGSMPPWRTLMSMNFRIVDCGLGVVTNLARIWVAELVAHGSWAQGVSHRRSSRQIHLCQ